MGREEKKIAQLFYFFFFFAFFFAAAIREMTVADALTQGASVKKRQRGRIISNQ